jgi:hypothetical protein
VTGELGKRPDEREGDDPYVLVTLCSALEPELDSQMGDRASMVLSETTEGASSDVIVVSPTHVDGLDALLTPVVGDRLRSLADGDRVPGILGEWFLARGW